MYLIQAQEIMVGLTTIGLMADLCDVYAVFIPIALVDIRTSAQAPRVDCLSSPDDPACRYWLFR
ncbi:hypothetical protein QE435_001637 [Rhizobium sp. SORGH_AS 787]|nr:hypothetical protein [Rhizobium sp. SORGH_AS_0787]